MFGAVSSVPQARAFPSTGATSWMGPAATRGSFDLVFAIAVATSLAAGAWLERVIRTGEPLR